MENKKKKTLEIILSTLETSGSVAECRLFSKARYTYMYTDEGGCYPLRFKADQICLI